MQFQVPQFIETEDKVVGPFSLKQFAYVGVACLITAIFYFLVAGWLAVVIGIVLIGGSLALSFIKVGGRPLITIAIAAANFYWKPQTYVWQPESTALPKAQPHASQKSAKNGLSLEDIMTGMALKKKFEQMKSEAKNPAAVENIAAGDALHKSWSNVQTGETRKTSSYQFLEKKMDERYQIFRKVTGERDAARRVDYR